jgi:hypothetical protein
MRIIEPLMLRFPSPTATAGSSNSDVDIFPMSLLHPLSFIVGDEPIHPVTAAAAIV